MNLNYIIFILLGIIILLLLYKPKNNNNLSKKEEIQINGDEIKETFKHLNIKPQKEFKYEEKVNLNEDKEQKYVNIETPINEDIETILENGYEINPKFLKNFKNDKYCPYCNKEFKKIYSRTFKCQYCENKVFVIDKVYLNENDYIYLKIQKEYLSIRENEGFDLESILLKRIEKEFENKKRFSIKEILFNYYNSLKERYLEIGAYEEYSWTLYRIANLYYILKEWENSLKLYLEVIFFEMNNLEVKSLKLDDSNNSDFEDYLNKLRTKYPSHFLDKGEPILESSSYLHLMCLNDEEWNIFLNFYNNSQLSNDLEGFDSFKQYGIKNVAPERWKTLNKIIKKLQITSKEIKLIYNNKINSLKLNEDLKYDLDKSWNLIRKQLKF